MTLPSRLRFRLVVATLLGSAFFFMHYQLQVVPSLVAQVPGSTVDRLFGTLVASVLVAASLLAAALAYRVAERPDARALALFLAFTAHVSAMDGIYWFRTREVVSPLLSWMLDASVPVAAAGALAALARFSVLFPAPLRPADLATASSLGGIRRRMLRPGWVWGGALVVGALGLGAPELEEPLEALLGREVALTATVPRVYMAVLVVGLCAAVLNLRTGHAGADALQRRRVFWVLEGLLAGTAVVLLASVAKLLQLAGFFQTRVHAWYALAIFAALLVILLCLAIAMFFAGAIDPTLAIRRTAVAGALGIALVFLLAATEQIVHARLMGWLGLSAHWGGVLTGGVVALSVERLKRRLDAVVGRVLGRLGLDAADLPDEVDAPGVPSAVSLDTGHPAG